MNRSTIAFLVLALVSISSGARAQTGEGAAPPATAAPAVPAASAAPRASCDLGEAGGLAEPQVRGWRMLLCDELAKQGVRAAPGAAGAQDVYRLDLLTLERKIVVRLTHERAGGAVATERAVISGGDEMLDALPRLVTAVTRGENFEQTATMTNLVSHETRPLNKQRGELFAGGSLLGMAPLGAGDLGLMSGLGAGLLYETPSLGVLADLRYAFREDSSTDSRNTKASGSWVALSLGVRHIFLDTDFSPFVGGGFALSWASITLPSSSSSTPGASGADSYQNSGAGLYGEVGIEALRTHRSRLTFGLRFDVPFYSVTGATRTTYSATTDGSTYSSQQSTPTARYELPVSLVATYYLP